MEIDNGIVLAAVESMEMHEKIIKEIFSQIAKLIDNKKYDVARTYIRMLAIDLMGKALTFPDTNVQEEIDYLNKWIKHRYKIRIQSTIL